LDENTITVIDRDLAQVKFDGLEELQKRNNLIAEISLKEYNKGYMAAIEDCKKYLSYAQFFKYMKEKESE